MNASRSVDCPWCSATRGHPCRTTYGRELSCSHMARIKRLHALRRATDPRQGDLWRDLPAGQPAQPQLFGGSTFGGHAPRLVVAFDPSSTSTGWAILRADKLGTYVVASGQGRPERVVVDVDTALGEGDTRRVVR